jgi:Rieske Fe-S protein
MTSDHVSPDTAHEASCPDRRGFLRAGVAAGLALTLRPAASAEEDKPGSDQRPQPGDVLVFAEDAQAGQPVKPADLASDGPLVPVWAMDPATKVVRDGSRLNSLVLVRLDPQSLDEDTRSASADGIVAYSAICTHAGCPITGFLEEQGQRILKCFCHNSVYDPRQQGTVLSGPATRRLAVLPVRVADGALTVAAKFNGKVGPTQSG